MICSLEILIICISSFTAVITSATSALIFRDGDDDDMGSTLSIAGLGLVGGELVKAVTQGSIHSLIRSPADFLRHTGGGSEGI